MGPSNHLAESGDPEEAAQEGCMTDTCAQECVSPPHPRCLPKALGDLCKQNTCMPDLSWKGQEWDGVKRNGSWGNTEGTETRGAELTVARRAGLVPKESQQIIVGPSSLEGFTLSGFALAWNL